MQSHMQWQFTKTELDQIIARIVFGKIRGHYHKSIPLQSSKNMGELGLNSLILQYSAQKLNSFRTTVLDEKCFPQNALIRLFQKHRSVFAKSLNTFTNIWKHKLVTSSNSSTNV
jgi:hypothetical protein